MRFNKALVVDDSKVVQFKLGRMLEARGLGVDAAGSGKDALDYLSHHAPDVIFMDFMMADMDGYEVTSIITANPATAAIPVIMCTGQDTPEARVRAQETGASGFVTKPIEDAALDALLASLQSKAAAALSAASAAAASESPAATTATETIAPALLPRTDPSSEATMAEVMHAAERAAREVAEKLAAEAMQSWGFAAEETIRKTQSLAAQAAQDVLTNWLVESAALLERAEEAASRAAEQASERAARRLREDWQAMQASEMAAVERARDNALYALRESADQTAAALARTVESAHAALEAIKHELQGSIRAAIDDASRNLLASMRAEMEVAMQQAIQSARFPDAVMSLPDSDEDSKPAAKDQPASPSMTAVVDSEPELSSGSDAIIQTQKPVQDQVDDRSSLAPPSTRWQKAIVPWLAATTLAVLYLLMR